jgi:methylglutaconyl-CoA hydratase
MAACDISVVHVDTVFSLSEVKIGIVPACISPYIIKRVGESKSRELMLTGRRFNGQEAASNGLANYSVEDIEKKSQEVINSLITSGPKAISQCKELIDQVVNHKTLEEAKKYTAEMIAEIRGSSEGQEGMSAFLEKRKPNWIDKRSD